MKFRRFITGICALALAGSLSAGAAQALSVDLISNGDFETGNLSGWSTTSNGSGESFDIYRGRGRGQPALNGRYDVRYDPRYAGISTLTQFFTVPDQVVSTTFSFAWQVGSTSIVSLTNTLLQVSVIDSVNNVLWNGYTNSAGTPVNQFSTDMTALMQSYQGQSLGVQFGFTPSNFIGVSGDATLDDIAMMVETPAAVPLPPTIWMMLAALGVFGFLGWKRRDLGNSASFTANPA
ncbi:PEP-CTERM domain protein [Thioclava indica]|uniref:Ice-binding protein C-terminal domain-containing protein n=1 Tax=Thioclava indica TaxID=1353528 RepID=A0A074K784_9RHOB|nr:PEP-CTERM domain protein [Thioclava indica]KEO57427.1 hypothetical protein DT23_04985 [Thioclava indica]